MGMGAEAGLEDWAGTVGGSAASQTRPATRQAWEARLFIGYGLVVNFLVSATADDADGKTLLAA